jgi:hypothetical protein
VGGGNLDLSRVGVINPKNASGDDANAFPISVLARNPPAAMMLQAKAAFGDDDDSLSDTGLCSDFYVFKWVLTASRTAHSFWTLRPLWMLFAHGPVY